MHDLQALAFGLSYSISTITFGTPMERNSKNVPMYDRGLRESHVIYFRILNVIRYVSCDYGLKWL